MGLCAAVFYGQKFLGFAVSAVVLTALIGCQSTSSVSVHRLIAHQALIDFSGLKSPQVLKAIDVAASIPNHWEALPLQNRFLYVHQQWRAPSHSTGVGVAHIHMPLPMTAKMIIWFAKTQYASQSNREKTVQGRLLGQWTDSVGREWFEAEDLKYHVKGYAITNGFDAWIIYSGYKLRYAPNMAEVAAAGRSMDSILPMPLVNQRANGTALASVQQR